MYKQVVYFNEKNIVIYLNNLYKRMSHEIDQLELNKYYGCADLIFRIGIASILAFSVR